MVKENAGTTEEGQEKGRPSSFLFGQYTSDIQKYSATEDVNQNNQVARRGVECSSETLPSVT